MAKYYIGLDVNLRIFAEVEAESLEEAIEMAKQDKYEPPNLNDYYYKEEYLVNVLSEVGNEVYKFND